MSTSFTQNEKSLINRNSADLDVMMTSQINIQIEEIIDQQKIQAQKSEMKDCKMKRNNGQIINDKQIQEYMKIEQKLHDNMDQFLEHLASKQNIEYSFNQKENNLLTSFFTYFKKRSKYLKQPSKNMNFFQLNFDFIPPLLKQDYQFLQLKSKIIIQFF